MTVTIPYLDVEPLRHVLSRYINGCGWDAEQEENYYELHASKEEYDAMYRLLVKLKR